MITVRVPDEIRRYKEKLVFGLTARQIISVTITAVICVPLYFYGRDYLSDDILSWFIIIIALPSLSIGFFKYRNMPMEKFAVAFLLHEFILPKKRLFRSVCAFKQWAKLENAQNIPNGFWAKRAYIKYLKESNLERTVLMQEAFEKGELMNFDANNANLLTVSKNNGFFGFNSNKGGSDGNGGNDGGKKKNKVKKIPKVQVLGEAVESKLKADPAYILTNKEHRDLRAWNNYKNVQRKNELNADKKKVKRESSRLRKRIKARSDIPKSTQQTIPFIADYEEGIFEVTPNKFSKMYALKDINYKTSKEEDQVIIFNKLCEFYNYFQEDVFIAVIIDNRYVSLEEQERKIFYREAGDDYDKHRHEFNRVLRRQMSVGKNDMQVEKFLTVTIEAENPIEALLRFHKIDVEVVELLRKFGSDASVLTTTERLSYYHDRFRKGHEGEFKINYEHIKSQGVSSKDYIAPTYFEFTKNHFKIDEDFYRVMYINNLPMAMSDNFFMDFCDNNFATTATLAIQPIEQGKGLKIIKKQLTGIEMNKIDAERKAVKAGYNPDTIRHDIKESHKQALQLYDDALNNDQKMFFVTMTVLVHGATLEELEDNCKALESKAGTITAQLQKLTSQQEEGFKITMPFGYAPKHVMVDRMLTTDSLTIFMPFSNQELSQRGGFYYGLNQISSNLIMLNRTAMKTPSGFTLGTSGSGKSFAVKRELLNVLLASPDTSIIVIDPENEYGDFARAFNGTVIKLSASADSSNYINPFDMSMDYGLDEDDSSDLDIEVKIAKARAKKSDFLMSIIERMISVGGSSDHSTITPQQRTLIDRCVSSVYQSFFDSGFDPALTPTMKDFQDCLDREKLNSEDGRKVAEAVEYYSKGSMSLFSHQTSVNIESRFVVFNVRDLGEQLRQIALTIVFDFIWNRMIENKNKGARTYCYCDEIHVMFQSNYAAQFLNQLYKRGRKYGLCITGITQNVNDLLRSSYAQGMISNSDYIMMLNQHAEDLKVLAQMLNISENQMQYVIGADAGSGLLFAGNVIVPFVDRFPSDSYLYKLMSTKFGEEMDSKTREDKLKKIMGEGVL